MVSNRLGTDHNRIPWMGLSMDTDTDMVVGTGVDIVEMIVEDIGREIILRGNHESTKISVVNDCFIPSCATTHS
jgi:hypothetical protein